MTINFLIEGLSKKILNFSFKILSLQKGQYIFRNTELGSISKLFCTIRQTFTPQKRFSKSGHTVQIVLCWVWTSLWNRHMLTLHARTNVPHSSARTWIQFQPPLGYQGRVCHSQSPWNPKFIFVPSTVKCLQWMIFLSAKTK